MPCEWDGRKIKTSSLSGRSQEVVVYLQDADHVADEELTHHCNHTT